MIAVYVLLGFVVTVIVYLLFAPFYIEINSIESLYRFRFHRIAAVSFFIDEQPTVLELKLFFWTKRINLKDQKKEAEKSPEPGSPKKAMKFPAMSKIISVLNSFKTQRFYVTFDSGDMQWNGMIYPAVSWIAFKTGKNISINFQGQNIFIIEIRNTLAHMSGAYLRS